MVAGCEDMDNIQQKRYVHNNEESVSSSRLYDSQEPEQVLLRYNVEEIYGARRNYGITPAMNPHENNQ